MTAPKQPGELFSISIVVVVVVAKPMKQQGHNWRNTSYGWRMQMASLMNFSTTVLQLQHLYLYLCQQVDERMLKSQSVGQFLPKLAEVTLLRHNIIIR